MYTYPVILVKINRWFWKR